jgi:hypothetical protein
MYLTARPASAAQMVPLNEAIEVMRVADLTDWLAATTTANASCESVDMHATDDEATRRGRV